MEDKIRAAYEQMGPTPEQEDRIWDALLEAQAAEGAVEGGDAAGAPAATGWGASLGGEAADVLERERVALESASPKRGGIAAWKVAIPVAACAVAVAVVVGAGSFGAAQSEAPSAASVQADAANGKAEDAASQAYTYDALSFAEEGGEVVEEPMPEPDEPFNTEEYAAVDENGFASTRTSPLSTVSADVDTASYANVRRMVNDGYGLADIPDGAVRVEEMLNYFAYDYAAPTGNDLFSVQAQASTCPWNPDTQLLVLGFATAEENRPAETGANLVFLIDVSGSMDSPDKLDLLKDSFATLLDNLDGRDRVSIVTYSGSERVVLDGASGNDRGRILEAIDGLQASGSTNGEAGLRMAYDVAERNFLEGGVNRIVMASDGDLNVGVTSESDLYDLVEDERATGVYLSVLGFGSGNYKDTKMEVLADHGNGSYHYIDSAEEAKRVLSERLMANLVPFADDVKVQVEFNPAQVKAYRLVGYENRELADEDFDDDAVDAGDVGPSAQFTVAYEVVLADSKYEVAEPRELKYGPGDYAGSGSSDWLTCSLRYRAFADDQVHEQSMVVDAGNSATAPSDDWKFASAVIEFAMLASDSHYIGSATPDAVLDLLKDVKPNDEREGFRDVVERAFANGERDRRARSGGDDEGSGHAAETRDGFGRDRR